MEFMVYRNMYVGYPVERNLKYCEKEEILTASIAYDEDCAFLYYESTCPCIKPEDIICGELKPFPDEKKWNHLPDIFHYFGSENENYKRNTADKTPVFALNQLYYDKVSSYIYYHVMHQEANQLNCDMFYSIYVYGNRILSYRETPTETVTQAHLDANGKAHQPIDLGISWHDLMNQHFQEWPDGHKGWNEIEDVRKLKANG